MGGTSRGVEAGPGPGLEDDSAFLLLGAATDTPYVVWNPLDRLRVLPAERPMWVRQRELYLYTAPYVPSPAIENAGSMEYLRRALRAALARLEKLRTDGWELSPTRSRKVQLLVDAPTRSSPVPTFRAPARVQRHPLSSTRTTRVEDGLTITQVARSVFVVDPARYPTARGPRAQLAVRSTS